MALHHEILREIIAGRVPWRFTTSDLKRTSGSSPNRYIVGNGEYAENAIKTIPRNHSVRPDGSDPGDYVRKGRKPAFFWFGRGEFELILEHEHYVDGLGPVDEGFDIAEGEEEALVRSTSKGLSRSPLPFSVDDRRVREIAEYERDPAAIVVAYIAEQPFQAYFRRKAVYSPKRGWGERLKAYFWPEPEVSWTTTCTRVERISRLVQLSTQKLTTCADDAGAAKELLDAFKAACAWGSVKVPESDPARLARETLRVLDALSAGTEPPIDCRLNSAWTKLYAFALPSISVIYDSRVASALTSIFDPAMPQISSASEWQPYSRLGTISGRGGTRPRSLSWRWPNGYGSWASQLAANRLCRNVVDQLNSRSREETDYRKIDDSTPWTLREVEAVLFMEGY